MCRESGVSRRWWALLVGWFLRRPRYEEILNFIHEQITHLRLVACRWCAALRCVALSWGICGRGNGTRCVVRAWNYTRPRCWLCFTGESRPEDPVAFIAECFVSGTVPEVAADRQESDQSLSAYLVQHQVVAIVQQAVGACAAAQPAPENPLQFVGEYIQDRHVGGAVRYVLCSRCSV